MQTILQQNDTHLLTLEKVGSEWWLELVQKSSGHVQIMANRSKARLLAMFKGMTIEDIKSFMDRANVELGPMYKPFAYWPEVCKK